MIFRFFGCWTYVGNKFVFSIHPKTFGLAVLTELPPAGWHYRISLKLTVFCFTLELMLGPATKDWRDAIKSLEE